MTCASCVATIEKGLRTTPGVHSAVVNLATGKAQVHGTKDLSRQALVDAVKTSGYSVREDSAPQEEEKGDRRETRRLIIAAALTIPLFAIAMGPHIMMFLGIGDHMSGMGGMEGMEGMEGMHSMHGMEGMENMTAEEMAAMGMDMSGMDMGGHGGHDGMAMGDLWLQFALAAPVVVYGGAPFFRGAWNAYRSRHLTMDTLVATGVGTAFGYSTAILIWPGLDSGQGVYFETAAVVVTLLLLGRLIEQRAQRRARATLRRMLEPTAKDTATGQMLEQAQTSKIPIQHAVDRIVRYFVPAVLVIAFAASIFWSTLGAPIAVDAGFTPSSMALVSLLTVLIIACPCALGLAVPMAVLTGTSRGAEKGIILRGGEALQAARGLDTVVIKKSTLTTGHPEVTDTLPATTLVLSPKNADELLILAASAAAKSDHALAIAIQRRAQGNAIPQAESFEAFPDKGFTAQVEGKQVLVGTPAWLASKGISLAEQQYHIERLRNEGKTVVGIAQDGTSLGIIATADPVRPNAARALDALRHQGLQVVLLTGDHAQTAHALAKPLGITRILADVPASDQAATIRHLKGEGSRVALVGDATTDAAAMAEAHLGITVGGRAGNVGGIALLDDDLLGIPAALDLARATLRKVHQNLAWAFAYNALLIPVAAGLLVARPLFGSATRLDPMLAGVAMTLSITSVMLNSLLLRRWQPTHSTSNQGPPGSFPLGSGNPVKA